MTEAKAPRTLSPRAMTLLLNFGLAAAGRGQHVEQTLGELRAYILELESAVPLYQQVK